MNNSVQVAGRTARHCLRCIVYGEVLDMVGLSRQCTVSGGHEGTAGSGVRAKRCGSDRQGEAAFDHIRRPCLVFDPGYPALSISDRA